MKIVYTDLDGTLLDHKTYSFQPAKPALDLIKKKKIPLVFCTSKTRAEIEYWRKKIKNTHPFISENGGGVFVPKNYFNFLFNFDRENDDYFIVEFGEKISVLKDVISDLQKKFDIISFLDMCDEEIFDATGLDSDQIKLAKQREYVLPFVIKNKKDEKQIIKEIKKNGLNVTVGGRFYHLMGDNSKGHAVCFLTNLFKKEFSNVSTLGFGDSKNDFSMLENVDRGFLVKKYDNGYASDVFFHAEGVGPVGWNKTVLKQLK